jgi:ketopantoate reductase
MMKVAIAGANGLALYLARYLQQTFHACIILTRSVRVMEFRVTIQQTDLNSPTTPWLPPIL